MYKVRCSKIGDIMTNPRSKSETLSKTAMTAVFEQYIQDISGRRKSITSKYLDKGIMQEEDAISLVSERYDTLYFKNEVKFEDEHMNGTPDILSPHRENPEIVIDTKCSWDIFTFSSVRLDEIDKGYYGQLQGYMHLTGAKKAQLCYVLVNMPQHMIAWNRANFDRMNAFTGNEWNEQEKNFIFDDIHIEDRVITFEVDYNEEYIQQVIERVELCRQYYDSLKHIKFRKFELKEDDLPITGGTE
jgi:hypothetical protein